MNISGFELSQKKNSDFCRNAYCSAINPICLAGVSPWCARNRSSVGWVHFSFGEHVCSTCTEYVDPFNSRQKVAPPDSVWRHRMLAWRRNWLRHSSQLGRRRGPAVTQFIAAQLLPWWLQCVRCGRWRQLPSHTPIRSRNAPDGCCLDAFTCSQVVKLSDDPCSWPMDERASLVQTRPQDFLASIHTHAWLQGSPVFNTAAMYGVDLVGVSPDPLPGALLGEADDETKMTPFKAFDEHGGLSLVDLRAWERQMFPEIARFPTLYLALRNLIICLWFKDPLQLLTSKFVAEHCFVRGLLRIVLVQFWIPRLVEEFTYRGIINIGPCRSVDMEHDLSKDLKPVRIQFVGYPDLVSAVTMRQILTSLCTDLPYPTANKNFIVQFQPVLPISFFEPANQQNSAAELLIRLSDSSVSSSDEDRLASTWAECLRLPVLSKKLPIPCRSTCGESQPFLNGELTVPLHMWSDRVFVYANHPMSIMAWQANMHLRPLGKCILLSNTSEAGNSLSIVPADCSIRIEFHVEAVLDLVAQAALNQSDTMGSQSVQELWDQLDERLRERLSDLVNSETERQLIEFYLASVEHDLTEPLTLHSAIRTGSSTLNQLRGSNVSSSCSGRPINCPTARLDCLPARLYASESVAPPNAFANNHVNSTSNDDNPTRWEPHLVCPVIESSGSKYIQKGAISHLSRSCFGSQAAVIHSEPAVAIVINSDLSSSIERVSQDLDNSSQLTHIPQVTSTPSIPVHDKPTDSFDDTKSSNVTIYNQNGTTNKVDWAVVAAPVSQLRLCFMDNHVDHTPLSNAMSSSCGYIPIYLPASFRSLLTTTLDSNLDDRSYGNRPSNSTSDGVQSLTESSARLITVTLIYRSAWWRVYLRRLLELMNEHIELEVPSRTEYFAFLPEDRSNRGFCHTFRDLCLELKSPGILQTSIIAAAADHWWDRSDVLLTAAVDRYLQAKFPIDELTRTTNADSVSEDGRHLTSSHIARLQHRSSLRPVDRRSINNKTALSIMDQTGQVLNLKTEAWEQLFLRGHLVVLGLIDNVFPGHSANNGFIDTINLERSFHQDGRSDQTVPVNDLFHTYRPPALDGLTTAIFSGLDVAELILRLTTSNRNTFADRLKYNNDTHLASISLSTLQSLEQSELENCFSDNSASPDALDASHQLPVSERAKRVMKRRRLDSEADS